MFTTAKEYPDFNIKGFPCTSLPTIVAYKLAVFYGHILLCDIISYKPTSLATEEFNSNPPLIKFLQNLKFMPVPSDVKILLEYLNPVLDTQRKNLKFVPSFAAFSFDHDFGYSVPISCFIAMHHIFATTKTNSDPLITMTRIYNTEIISIAGLTYTIGNLFGGPYTLDGTTHIHNNWLNNALEAFINPVVSGTLLQRPTFSKTPMEVYAPDDATPFNSYRYLFGDPEVNQTTLHSVLTDVARFTASQEPSAPPLGTILDQSTGLTIMTHAIESLSLPTWHGLPQCTVPTEKYKELNLKLQNDASFVKTVNFLQSAPIYTEKFLFTDTSIEPELYLVDNNKFDPDLNPLNYIIFDDRRFRNAQVLWFQPYDKSSQSIELSILLGLRIVNSCIYGLTLPTPNLCSNLTRNNSFYLAGTIPTSHIQTYIPSSDVVKAFTQFERERRTLQTEPIGHSIRDMSQNSLPIMCDEDVSNEIDIDHSGLTHEHNHACPALSGTVVAWRSTSKPHTPKDSTYLWSSYRTIDYHPYSGEQDISMYSSLRGLFGTCVTLTRSAHPSRLLPS